MTELKIRYTDEDAMNDLIELSRKIMDVVCAKGIEVSITALPDNGEQRACSVVNVGEYIYAESYRSGGTLYDLERHKRISPKDVILVKGAEHNETGEKEVDEKS